MKKKIFSLLLLFITPHVSDAVVVDDTNSALVDDQENQLDTYVPLVQNYPSFMVELLGMDYLYNQDAKVSVPFHKMKKFDWHSLFRGNGAILYAMRIHQSRFTFCIGAGWSTLYYTACGKDVNGETVYPTLTKKSKFCTVYEDMGKQEGKEVLRASIKIPFIDFLLRLRFNNVLEDPKAGFHTWLGVKFGLRRCASTTIDHKEYDNSGASSIYNGHFNLKQCAFGLQTGIGYGRFGLTGGFYFTSLFKENEGPSNVDLLSPISIGVYVDLI